MEEEEKEKEGRVFPGSRKKIGLIFFFLIFFFFHNPSRIIIIIIIIKNMPQLQVQGWPVAFSILTLAT